MKTMEQRKRIFGALDDLMRSPIGERLRERMFRELSTKEIHDMLQKEQKPYKELMAYYQCALMEVETKFRVLNEQFSLVHDRKFPIDIRECIYTNVDRNRMHFYIRLFPKFFNFFYFEFHFSNGTTEVIF